MIFYLFDLYQFPKLFNKDKTYCILHYIKANIHEIIRRIDVSTNTPDERIVNLESRFSKVDSKIIEFQSDFIDIKQRLISVESDVTDIKSRLDTLESNGKYKQIERKIETEIKYLDTKYQNDIGNLNQKIPSEEKIDKALSVTEDFKQLKQKVDTIGQELEGAKVSLGETQNSISTFKKDLKNVADKQKEWLINHDTKPKQPVENTTQLKLEIDELRQNFKQMQERLKAKAVEYYTNNVKEIHVTIETLKTNIGKVKAELKTEIGERQQNVKVVNRNMADMKSRISKVEVELKTEIGERQQNVKEIDGNMADMKSQINKVEVELKTEIGERQQNVKEIDGNMADMKSQINKVEVELKTEIGERQQNVKEIDGNMADMKGRINKVEVELKTEIGERQQNVNEINRNMADMKSRISKVEVELKTEIGERQQRQQNVKEIDGNMADMKSQINKVEVELKTEIGERQQNVKEIDGNMADMKSQINKVEVELKTEIGERQQNGKEIDGNMADMKGRINKVEVELKTEIGERQQNVNEINRNMADMKGQISKVEVELKTEIGERKQKQQTLRTSYKVNKVVGDHDEKLSEVHRLQNYQGKIHDENHAILFFIQRFVPSRSVLDQIQHQGILKQEVCVVSFYSETQPLHQRLTKSAVPDGTQIKTIVVENHDKILKLPHSKTFLENKVLTTYDELTPYQKVHLNKNLWR
ncbi:hypothetical protein KUTeg_006429 [Tegillarca granosa]|uniref:Uncharacterized protein n=1 Tax=Tegillarca granosa TaxID=220873 RepID=A0ABQ9FGJ4_TEGGR|nr:hypothetical protein KUTeg_006429 [Tegillarca granosa]